MKYLILLVVLCYFIPGLGAWILDGMPTLIQICSAFMPCIIILVGLYILVESKVYEKLGE